MPKVLTGVGADLFVCHDPFEEKLKAANRWTNTVVVGYLEPVLAVRPGNPKHIRGLDDLAKPDLKIGISTVYQAQPEVPTPAITLRPTGSGGIALLTTVAF